jgi:signal transduction histidine kinase/ActR/RegA family two-component response regulator
MTWWLGDAAGAVVIAPAIVLWVLDRRHYTRGKDWTVEAAVYVGAGAIGFVAFSGLITPTGSAGPFGFLAILPLTWAALRRSPRDTATIALILSGFAVWGTLSGAGPFAQTSLNDSFLLLLTFMISTSVPSLALSADVAMRTEIEANLRRANEEMDRRVQERTAELVSTQQELHQAQKMEALGQLTGGVAHDFNNLLTAVLGSLELAMKRVTEARILRLLTTAQQAAERGAALTAQMLAFSRRQDPVRRPVDVNTVILEIEELLRRTIGPLIRITYNLEDNLWPAVADPAQLEMALLNLAVNSRDAMPLGGSLIVQTRRITQDEPRNLSGIPSGDYVLVSVVDTGSGMPGDVVARAFDPFFTTKGPGRGSGLGLSMVYGFAKQIGGTATIDSVPGEGTTVTLYLPRSFEDPHSRQEGRPVELVPTATQSILVVDDDDDVRKLTVQMLEEMGHEVIDAASGRAALDTLKAGHACDLLLLDFAMPVMNGGECAAEAQRLRPHLPILFITGYVDEEALKSISDLGCRLLRKPFQYADLAQAVHEASGLNSRTGKVVPIASSVRKVID